MCLLRFSLSLFVNTRTCECNFSLPKSWRYISLETEHSITFTRHFKISLDTIKIACGPCFICSHSPKLDSPVHFCRLALVQNWMIHYFPVDLLEDFGLWLHKHVFHVIKEKIHSPQLYGRKMVKSLIHPWMAEWCSEVWTSSIAWQLRQRHGAIAVAGVLKHEAVSWTEIIHSSRYICNFTFVFLRKSRGISLTCSKIWHINIKWMEKHQVPKIFYMHSLKWNQNRYLQKRRLLPGDHFWSQNRLILIHYDNGDDYEDEDKY
jgi:hypothetical protein